VTLLFCKPVLLLFAATGGAPMVTPEKNKTRYAAGAAHHDKATNRSFFCGLVSSGACSGCRVVFL
jgi:hypothetical protein